jgi:hypothetical protein
MRSNAKVLIYVDMDGIKFYQARNGVIQTRGIERVLSPAYFAQTLFCDEPVTHYKKSKKVHTFIVD